MSFVLDASAILAVLLNESGSELVLNRMELAIVSAVNYSEVAAKLSERNVAEEIILESTAAFQRIARPFDAAQALAAGLMHKKTIAKGLSLGDRACLALAIRENATVLTADRAWVELDLGVNIELIR